MSTLWSISPTPVCFFSKFGDDREEYRVDDGEIGDGIDEKVAD